MNLLLSVLTGAKTRTVRFARKSDDIFADCGEWLRYIGMALAEIHHGGGGDEHTF
jgi:hypothetical protein